MLRTIASSAIVFITLFAVRANAQIGGFGTSSRRVRRNPDGADQLHWNLRAKLFGRIGRLVDGSH